MSRASASMLWMRTRLSPRAGERSPLALACQPAVPEIQARRGAEVAAQLAAGHVERVVVAELHLADVLVVDRLDAVDDRLALLHVALLAQLGDETLFFLVAPPALERAAKGDVERGIGVQGVAGDVRLP